MYTFINYVFLVTCAYTRLVSLLEPPSLCMYIHGFASCTQVHTLIGCSPFCSGVVDVFR